MAVRCPDCSKFASFDTDVEPEVQEPEVGEDGHVSLEVRIVNGCADCGSELTEANFTLEGDVEVDDHKGEKHELEAEVEDIVRTDESRGSKNPRYAKRFYGVEAIVVVKCSCGQEVGKVSMKDEVQASGMEQLV